MKAALILFLFAAFRVLALDPTGQTGLQLWYDADQEAFTDGASITTFTDRSGNAHHGTPNTGTVATLIHAGHNGKKVARMANNTNYFNAASPFTLTGNFTVTFVTKQTTDSVSYYARSTNNNASISLNRELVAPKHGIRFRSTNGGDVQSIYSEIQTSAKMACYTMVNNAGFITSYLNGEPMRAYGTIPTDALAEMQFSKILGSAAFQADVGEIFVYNDAKSQTDVRAMFTGYIQGKYNLTPKAVFFAHGNSLTACMMKDAQYTLRDDFECWEKAWPGQVIQKLVDEYQTWAMPHFSAARPMNVYAALELHNGLPGTSGQDTYFTEYKNHLLAVKAYALTQGVTVKTLAVTCPASTKTGNAGSADWQAAWAHYNGRIRNEWRDFADGLADIAALPEGDNLTDTLNATYYDPDGTHHTTAFEQLIGEQVFTPALQLLLNPPGTTMTVTNLNAGTLRVGAP